ncbi:MAG: type III-B CRISPR module RAMP protein Cmr4 [Bryobacteraceae bacterium]
MPANAMAVFMLTETSLHAGTGATLSYVDLPIQREVHTGHPVVNASGVKGGLRELCEARNGQKSQQIICLFGPEGEGDHGGMGIFKEARVLLFPVRSYKGTFAWVASPLVLSRFFRDLEAIRSDLLTWNQTQLQLPVGTIGEEEGVFCGDALLINGQAVLEEYALRPKEDPAWQSFLQRLAQWLAKNAFPQGESYRWWREKMWCEQKHDQQTTTDSGLVIVADETFDAFVRLNTEIRTHVQIGKTGTVAEGPWNEESLPADTLLYTVITVPKALDGCQATFPDPERALEFLQKELDAVGSFQLCGDRSLGKGLVRATCLK